MPETPADKAGVVPGMRLLAINGRKFDDELLKDAVAATPSSKTIELLFENATYFRTAKLTYAGGPRSPHLDRVSEAPT